MLRSEEHPILKEQFWWNQTILKTLSLLPENMMQGIWWCNVRQACGPPSALPMGRTSVDHNILYKNCQNLQIPKILS